jgi:uncharacterized integral membrane protein
MVRFILGIVFGILVIVFMVQNTAIVEIAYFGATITISRALMVLIVLLIGVLIGWVIRSIGVMKKKHEVRQAKREG